MDTLLSSGDIALQTVNLPKNASVMSFLRPLIVDGKEKPELEKSETAKTIVVQVCLPLLIAGVGMVAAGLYLDHVQVSYSRRHSLELIFKFLFNGIFCNH